FYKETCGVWKIFLEMCVIHDSVTHTEHAKRTTVTALNVVCTPRRSGARYMILVHQLVYIGSLL
ncbi:uncharacterized protein LACBIDRAFT_250677, partial [Laccaria bicolor S238N-H82]